MGRPRAGRGTAVRRRAPTATPSTVRSVTTTTIRPRIVVGDPGRRDLLVEADHAQAAAYPTAELAHLASARPRPVHEEPSQGGRVAGRPGRRPAYIPSPEHGEGVRVR